MVCFAKSGLMANLVPPRSVLQAGGQTAAVESGASIKVMAAKRLLKCACKTKIPYLDPRYDTSYKWLVCRGVGAVRFLMILG